MLRLKYLVNMDNYRNSEAIMDNPIVKKAILKRPVMNTMTPTLLTVMLLSRDDQCGTVSAVVYSQMQ